MEKLDERKVIKTLEEMGGNLWEKGDKRRVYFNCRNIATVGGFEVEYYKSGNVMAARLKGDTISNSEARRILGYCEYHKFYYDLVDNKLHFMRDPWGFSESFSEKVKEALEKVAAPDIADVIAEIAARHAAKHTAVTEAQ